MLLRFVLSRSTLLCLIASLSPVRFVSVIDILDFWALSTILSKFHPKAPGSYGSDRHGTSSTGGGGSSKRALSPQGGTRYNAWEARQNQGQSQMTGTTKNYQAQSSEQEANRLSYPEIEPTYERSHQKCPICFEECAADAFKKLRCCSNFLCKVCEPKCKRCPFCKAVFGHHLTGDQPLGTMTCSYSPHPVAGYEGCGSYIITYGFPSGSQGAEHPNPGRSYSGIHRTAYLPGTFDGFIALKLLRLAFIRRLTFTISTSSTTGRDNSIVWDIHHKTSRHPGTYGYPDPTYLMRLNQELQFRAVSFDNMTAEERANVERFTSNFPRPTF